MAGGIVEWGGNWRDSRTVSRRIGGREVWISEDFDWVFDYVDRDDLYLFLCGEFGDVVCRGSVVWLAVGGISDFDHDVRGGCHTGPPPPGVDQLREFVLGGGTVDRIRGVAGFCEQRIAMGLAHPICHSVGLAATHLGRYSLCSRKPLVVRNLLL